jgi:AP-3 complex subunit sigma
MIEAFIILNKLGLLRFLKIFSEKEDSINKEDLIKRISHSVLNTKDTSIIFDLDFGGQNRKIVFRLFGTIYLIMIIDDLENELAMLDFINVVIGVLDDVFKGVCELHLIMNPEKIYFLVDEMISGGSVIETSRSEITANYLDKMKDDDNYKFFSK